ncbi:hypothetical protein MTP99_005599 [Tenebrio molitor]|nr:hypothetical protein MTP99_005599 [Tenebrio molitor]
MKWYFSHYALLARRLKWYDEVIRGTKMQFEAPKCPHIRVYVLTVGLHERHVSTAWAISVVLGGNRRPTTGAGRKHREIRIYQQRAAKGPDLYRVHPELKLLVLRLFVSLIYRPITNPANTKTLARP